ncbi:MAG: cadmium-translocating P-type ATPase [Victivallales bacterium]|nr:cadmium-translocating P-type ATPase [Victivallales bacterium]
MERKYTLKGLDCPNCAAKIEKGVISLSEVEHAVVDLQRQSLTVVSEASREILLGKIKEVVLRYEPDVEVAERPVSIRQPHGKHTEDEERRDTIWLVKRLFLGAVMYGIGLVLMMSKCISPTVEMALFVLSYSILGFDVLWHALRNLSRGRVFDEHFLMSVSTIVALLIGEAPEAVAVMLFYQLGELFQSMAVRRSRKSISELMDMRPDVATVERNGELAVVSPEDVGIGETIVVKPGEKIPMDGVVVKGTSMLDMRALTGESIPKMVKPGDEALSGSINQNGVMKIETTKLFAESTASRILDLVENASANKSKTENFITSFASIYTPVVFVMAAILALLPPLICGGEWTEWLHRGCVFLVVSCPCALVISIPLTYIGGLGAASRRGILVKGGNFLETLTNIGIVVFDKTGTLTKGVFNVIDILPEIGYSKEDVLEYAAKAEYLSNHPIAKSILQAYKGNIEPSAILDRKEFEGQGIRLRTDDMTVLVGNEKLMEKERIAFTPSKCMGTKVYVAVDGRFAGSIVISDEIKEDSRRTIKKLKQHRMDKIAMLTGDDKLIAKAVGDELKMTEIHSNLLPEEKVEIINKMMAEKRKGSKLAFVGDGMNDAPVIARADIGIAMGALGSEAAIEASDVVLMTDEPSKLLEAIDIAHATKRIVLQNIILAIGVKALFLLLGALGIAGMWEAVFGDVGVTIITILNAMRI